MSFVTSKAYVRPADKIRQIEEIPVIKGSVSAGAKARYMSKDDYPKLGGLVEDGFAADLYLPKDLENRRMVIAFNEASTDIDFDSRLNLEEKTKIEGVIDYGVADGSRAMIEPGKESNYVLFWYNGNWALIEKYVQGETVLIPESLANEVYKSTRYSKVKICDDFMHVAAKDVATLSNCTNLYSQWTFENVLYVMINTDTKNGPYKFQRTGFTFNIWMQVSFLRSHFKNHYLDYMAPDLNSFDAYKNAILSGFKLWGGSYGTEQTRFASGITVNLTIGEHLNMLKKGPVQVINQVLNGSANVSNVLDTGWKADNIGEMEIFTHTNGAVCNQEKLKTVAAHELGHFLGLGDAYGSGDGSDAQNYVKEAIDPDDIMLQTKSGSKVTPNDIEMLFLAVLKNKKQYFHTDGDKEVSAALIEQDLRGGSQ